MNLPEITPHFFRRHRRQLRAFLIGHEAWFSSRDLRRLVNADIDDRITRQLCDDQHRRVLLRTANGWFDEEVVISESGLHALLCVYCYHPENRLLRQWVSQEVVAGLWSGRALAG